MLTLPERGMSAKSVTAHNINFEIFCDWIEGNVLLADGEISTTDVVDVLIENHIYDDQDFAQINVENAWSEIKRRLSWLGAKSEPITLSDSRATSNRTWQEIPAHSFCLVLSFAKLFPEWAEKNKDYLGQGELFEELTKESMKVLLPGWEIHSTGWSKNHAVTLRDVVDEIIVRVGDAIGNIDRWAAVKAKEAGLDLLCYRSFADGRIGKPVFLMQCASGGNWDEKLHTPDLMVWKKIIDWASEPKKAFSMPYALSDKEFIKKSNLVDGLLVDRYRLLSASSENSDWLSDPLRKRLIAWLEPRIEDLPSMD
jgi:hypothetical protein